MEEKEFLFEEEVLIEDTDEDDDEDEEDDEEEEIAQVGDFFVTSPSRIFPSPLVFHLHF